MFLRAFEHWLPLAAEDPETGRGGGRPEETLIAGVRLPRGRRVRLHSLRAPANSSAVNAAHLKDGKNGHRLNKALEGGDSRGLHPAFRTLSSRPFPTRWAFQDPRERSG